MDPRCLNCSLQDKGVEIDWHCTAYMEILWQYVKLCFEIYNYIINFLKTLPWCPLHFFHILMMYQLMRLCSNAYQGVYKIGEIEKEVLRA
jgi:hypothetical protein